MPNKIRPPLPSEPKPPPNVLSRTLACRNCGEPYIANPPDDLHTTSTLVTTEFSAGLTCVKIPYSCKNCGRINLLYWYSADNKDDEHVKLAMVYAEFPDESLLGDYSRLEKEVQTNKLVCVKCDSQEFEYVRIIVTKNDSVIGQGDGLRCANASCKSILATTRLTEFGNFSEDSPTERTKMEIRYDIREDKKRIRRP